MAVIESFHNPSSAEKKTLINWITIEKHYKFQPLNPSPSGSFIQTVNFDWVAPDRYQFVFGYQRRVEFYIFIELLHRV